MQAGAERHSRVKADHDLISSGLVFSPRRPDDEATANALNGEVLLPRLGPVLLVDDARLKLAYRSQLEGL